MMINDSNVTIMVKDMDRSVDFYQSIGFEIKNRWGNHYAQVEAPGMVIGLHPAGDSSAGSPGNVSLGFTTGDFEGAKSLLEKLPVNIFLRNEEGGRFIHFNEPDGTPLYFIEPKW